MFIKRIEDLLILKSVRDETVSSFSFYVFNAIVISIFIWII